MTSAEMQEILLRNTADLGELRRHPGATRRGCARRLAAAPRRLPAGF
jgi:hypothetical protein